MKRFCLWKHLSDVCGKIKIIDIGAMDVAGNERPYKSIIHPDIGRIIGFEPNKEECGKLNYASENNCVYLPEYIGNGKKGIFKTCAGDMCSSFYEPNMGLLEKFQYLAELAQVTNREEQQTKRLDDMRQELKGADYLKIDVQGAEIDVFEGAANLLTEEIVLIHTEVCFVPLYIDQPLFAEIDQALRRFGFLFHQFFGSNFCGRAFKPVYVKDRPQSIISQTLWTDAIYVRDFNRFDELSVGKLLKLAIILHDVYGSYDLANLALEHYDRKDGSHLADYYKATLVAGNGKNEVRGNRTES